MLKAGRRDWVQADLLCILCGRVMGRLVGPAPASRSHIGTPILTRPDRFSAFRPVDPTEPAVRLAGGEQFRCRSCGGGAIVDEVETFSTYDDVDLEDEPRQRRRGRPPKPWRRAVDARIAELGLAG